MRYIFGKKDQSNHESTGLKNTFNYLKMRKLSDLLEVILQNKKFFGTGLCGLIIRLYYAKIITAEEEDALLCYIDDHAPKNFFYDVYKDLLCKPNYWYPLGWWWPRERWIKKHIKKLSKQGM